MVNKTQEKQRLNQKKKQALMIQALKSNGMNVADACRAVGVTRSTHYLWMDTSDTYKKEVEDVSESLIDFVETHLIKAIKKGNITAMIFYLKTRAKHRGYVESTEIRADLTNDLVLNINGKKVNTEIESDTKNKESGKKIGV